MDESRLMNILTRNNPWWYGGSPGKVKSTDHHRRRDFDYLSERIETERVVTLCGPRQVGKTTLMLQFVESLLDSDHPRDHILYLTTEAGTVISDSGNILAEAIEAYEGNLVGDYDTLDSTAYILIDEIQKVNGWADTIKFYADRYDSLKFLVSGSVSTLISDEADETLFGRAAEQTMVPMKFVDFLRYYDVLSEDQVTTQSRALRSEIKESVINVDHQDLALSLSRANTSLSNNKSALRNHLEKYVLRGGYPKYFDMTDSEALAALDTDLYRIIVGDLANTFNVDEPVDILRIMGHFADSVGNKLNISELSRAIGIDRDTVKKYIRYLEKFYLVHRCQHYSTLSRGSSKQPTVYISDPGHLSSQIGVSVDDYPDTEEFGYILENAVCDHLKRIQFNLSDYQNTDVGYSEDYGEIDFILSGSEYLVPVEVKKGDTRDRDLTSLKRFLDNNPESIGFAINNSDVFSHEQRLIHIPAWLFFYLC